VKALVVGDTHLTAASLERMPSDVWQLADEADVVLHTGDVVDRAVLAALGERAVVHAVLGNNDRALVGTLPEVLEVELGGVPVAMIHDSGPTSGRAGRMRQRFPGAAAVLFGHSHHPLVEWTDDGTVLFNPGSPTQRRRQPVHTVGWLGLADGTVEHAEIVEVGPLARRAPEQGGATARPEHGAS
jgi:putative phosphoesterase